VKEQQREAESWVTEAKADHPEVPAFFCSDGFLHPLEERQIENPNPARRNGWEVGSRRSNAAYLERVERIKIKAEAEHPRAKKFEVDALLNEYRVIE
jgi:hypothetical protein